MTFLKNKIRIALLGTFPPTRGGISTNLEHLMKSPLKQQFIFLKFQTMSRKQGSLTYFKEKIWMKRIRVVFDLFQFIFFMRSQHIRFVHINSSLGPWSFWRDSVYLLLCKGYKLKVLMQFHGGNLEEFTKRYSKTMHTLIKKIVAIPDQIAVCSFRQKHPFQALGLSQKTTVIRNMVAINPNTKRIINRNQFSIPEKAFVFLFVSAQFYRKKGIIEFLDTFSFIQSIKKNAVFVLAGGGTDDSMIMERIAQEQENKRIIFTGHLDFDCLQKLFCASDCFVMPSHSEGLPLTLLEAMASALPVVATPVGAIPEVIKDGINGFLVPVGDYRALAEKMILLATKPFLATRMGKKNLKKIKNEYEIRIVAKEYNILYNKLINGSFNDHSTA